MNTWFSAVEIAPATSLKQSDPSFVGRRQQHIDFVAETVMEFTPQSANECAGLVLVQNNEFHFRFVVTRENENIIRLIKRSHGKDQILHHNL